MGADQQAPASSNGRSTRSSRLILGDAQFRYYPLWEVRGNDIFCYLCEPFWDVGTGEPLPEDALQTEFADPKRILALDLETLRKATEQVEEVVAQYGLMTVLIPVHFETLTNTESADAYIQLCDKLIWPVLESVYFEIVSPPIPLSKDGLVRVADRIKPYGRGLLLRVEPSFDRFDQIPADDILSVGMDFRADQRDEGETLSDLKRFASDSGSRGLHSHAHGMKTLTLSLAAVSAGFDFVGSDAISPPLEKWASDEETLRAVDLFKTLLPMA